MNLDISSGYWLRMADDDTLDGSGHPLNPNRIYDLHNGANLVSFPSTGSVGISAGLPDDIEDNVLAIIGEGYSAVNTDAGWIGALLDFEALHGYWMITDDDISFSYELDEQEFLSRNSNPYKTAEKPLGFDFIQSTQQAFYFVDNIELVEGEIEEGDWLISYCGNTVTGTRPWLGRAVDILTGHINTSSVLNLVKLAQNIGFNGLGLNFRNERKSRFLHLDNRDSSMDAPFNQPAIWTY